MVEKVVAFLLQFLSGIFCIYVINSILGMQGIVSGVGINEITMVVSAVLGIPGIIALYGIRAVRL